MTSATKGQVMTHGSGAAQEFHRCHPPIDLHADPLMWARWGGYDLTVRHRTIFPGGAWIRHVDVPRLMEACVGAQFLGLTSIPGRRYGAFHSVMEQLDILDDIVRRDPRVTFAVSAHDVERAAAQGRIALLAGLQGVHALCGELERLETLAVRGVRRLGLAHFTANRACRPMAGLGSAEHEGLSAFGRDVIRLCEDLGVIVDLAHLNRKAFMQACAMASKPMIVSHGCLSGVHQHWRGIDDYQVRALAATGGVIGIMFARSYLGGDLSVLVEHIRRVIEIAGVDHVALGSDYDGMIVPVRELSHVAKLPNLTTRLIDDDFDADVIAKVLRLNALRILREVPSRAFQP